MKLFGSVAICLFALLTLSIPVQAQEFQWVDDFNQTAAKDVEAFKSRMAQRFGAELDQVASIIETMKTPADAYMAFKFSEMSEKPVSQVAQTYKKEKKKGWGALAKSLGIKPGSEAFHALKKGHDLDRPGPEKQKAEKGKKNKGKGKNKGKKDK